MGVGGDLQLVFRLQFLNFYYIPQSSYEPDDMATMTMIDSQENHQEMGQEDTQPIMTQRQPLPSRRSGPPDGDTLSTVPSDLVDAERAPDVVATRSGAASSISGGSDTLIRGQACR